MTNEQYYDLIKPYEDARRVMNTRLEVLNHSLYKEKNVSGPIHNIQGRLKEKRSIEDKLRRLGFTDSIVNARNELQDIAGIRVICYFVNDIYNMVNILKRQTDLVVIKEKDYIQSPKPNGYRSLHLVLGIPVYCLDTMEYFPVEVQFRTMAMDFWASLEHKIAYKFEGNAPENLLKELKACADMVDMLDAKMFSLNEAIMKISEDEKAAETAAVKE